MTEDRFVPSKRLKTMYRHRLDELQAVPLKTFARALLDPVLAGLSPSPHARAAQSWFDNKRRK